MAWSAATSIGESVTRWSPVAWLATAFGLSVGLRERSWRAGVSALAWAALTGLALELQSNAGPLAVSVAMLLGGLVLLGSVVLLETANGASRLLPRAVTVCATAMVVTSTLTVMAGPWLVGWTGGSSWLAFALLLPAGMAFGAAAVAPAAVAEERLAYYAAGLVPAMVLFAGGSTAASGMPSTLLVGLVFAGMFSVLRPVLRVAGIPARPALFLAVAEVVRAGMFRSGGVDPNRREDAIGMMVSIVIVVIMVAVLRRRGGAEQWTAEREAPDLPPVRPHRTLLDLTRNPGERRSRFRAELLLRLSRLFPKQSAGDARGVAREAATAAAALSPHPDQLDRLEEPVRRDLLWQIAKESWRRRDYAGAARAAWLVEWRRWSGLLVATSAVATGAILGVEIRWILAGQGTAVRAFTIAAGALAAVAAAVPRLRSLREPLLALPLTVLAASWVVWGGETLWRVVPIVLAVLLFTAAGTPGSGSVLGWASALILVLRRQVVSGVCFGTLAASVVLLSSSIFLRPAAQIFILAGITLFLDPVLKRPARSVLRDKAHDIPPLGPAGGAQAAVFEGGTFSDEVGAAVVRMAEREPESLPGIARAVMSVR
jgi:hypothetical protein